MIAPSLVSIMSSSEVWRWRMTWHQCTCSSLIYSPLVPRQFSQPWQETSAAVFVPCVLKSTRGNEPLRETGEAILFLYSLTDRRQRPIEVLWRIERVAQESQTDASFVLIMSIRTPPYRHPPPSHHHHRWIRGRCWAGLKVRRLEEPMLEVSQSGFKTTN